MRAAFGAHHGRVEAVDLGLFGHELAGADRGHVPGAVLLHQREDLVVHVGAVFDADHAALDRAAHAFLAVRVGRHPVAVVLGGGHHGGHFVFGELRAVAVLGVAQHAAGGGDLDHVRAFLVALAHGGAGFVGTVDHALDRAGRAHRLRQLAVEAVGDVGVAAGGGDRTAGGVDARAVHQALVDRVAQGQGGVAAQVAHGGEAGLQGLARVAGGAQHGELGVEAEAFGIAVGAGLAVQVHVQVDPAGAAGVALEVHRARAVHGRQAGADLAHLAVGDHHGLVGLAAAAGAVEQLAAVQGEGLGLGERRAGQGKGRAAADGGSGAWGSPGVVAPMVPVAGGAASHRRRGGPRRAAACPADAPICYAEGLFFPAPNPCPTSKTPTPTTRRRWKPPRKPIGRPPAPSRCAKTPPGPSTTACPCCRTRRARCTWAMCATTPSAT